MRNEDLQNALKIIDDPSILVNVVSQRVKQLKRGHRALVTSLEKLALEDIALREIAEGKITYELGPWDEFARGERKPMGASLASAGTHAQARPHSEQSDTPAGKVSSALKPEASLV